MRRAGGFTLLEILLVLAILGAVLVAAHTMVSGTIDARERIKAATAPLATTVELMALMREDLRGVFRDDPTEGQFIGGEPEDQEAPFLSFITATDPFGRAKGLIRVAYRLERNKKNQFLFDLKRAYGPKDGRWQADNTELGEYETIVRGISGISVEFFNGSEWVKEWTEADNLPPPVVRITIEMPDGEEKIKQTSDIAIPSGVSTATI